MVSLVIVSLIVVPFALFVLVFLFCYCCGRSATNTPSPSSSSRGFLGFHDGTSDNRYAPGNWSRQHHVQNTWTFSQHSYPAPASTGRPTTTRPVYNIVNERQRPPGLIKTTAAIDSDLRQLQEQIKDENTDKEKGSEIVRSAQVLILSKNEQPTENSLHCKILIGVDATPRGLGGYCINLSEKTMQFYHIKMVDFPWTMEDPKNPDEFEMKNLQFAMALWGNVIRTQKTFRIYTDNSAANKKDNKFGLDAAVLIDHFTECEKVRKINELEHLNRKLGKMEQFAIYIQPADDFSRWEIEKGVDFLCKYYGIDRKKVQGTHTLSRKETPKSKAWYDQNENYRHYIQRAKTFASNLKCENCNINTFTNEPTRGRPSAMRERARQPRSRSQPRRAAKGRGRKGRNHSEPRRSHR